jgi:PAS domain S-box-containing protein
MHRDEEESELEALREAQRALALSEERLACTFDVAPIGMALTGLDFRFQRVNRVLCSIVGYAREELLARTFQDITHPDDLDADLDLVGKLLRREIERYELAKRYIRKDGSIAPVVLHAAIVRDASGAPACFVAQIEDVSERRRVEQALLASEMQMRGLFDNALDAMLVADEIGTLIDVNTAACALLGAPRAKLLGLRLRDLVPDELVGEVERRFERLLADGEQKGEITLLGAGNARLEVEYGARAHFAPGRHLLAARDVTERKRTEAALRQSEETLAIAQRIAHVGNWEWDAERDRIQCSEEARRLLGIEPDAFSGTYEAFLACVHPDDRDRIRAAVHATLVDGAPYELELRVVRPDGSVRIIEEHAQVVRSDRGARVVGTAQDVTECRAATARSGT